MTEPERGPVRAGGKEGDALMLEARVLEALPNALFRVELLTGPPGRATVHVSGSSSLLRLLPGDEVVVELMPYDMTRGRVVRKR